MVWQSLFRFHELELSQKAGIILGFSFFLLGWMDVGYEMIQRDVFHPQAGMVLWICAAFFLSTAVFTSVRSRIVQVFAMFAAGAFMAGIRGIGGMEGAMVMVLSFLFADTYGLMQNRRGVKLLAGITFAILIIETSSILQFDGFFNSTGSYLVLLGYLVFQIFRYHIMSRQLESNNAELYRQIDANHVFIEVGQNTSGLVHDLKNDICRISYPRQHAQRQVRKMLETATSEYVPGLRRIDDCLGEIKEGEQRLLHSLQVVRRIPAGFVRSDERYLDVSVFIRDMCSFLMFRREFRHNVRISIQAPEKALWFGAESDLAALCKNLVENACQATLDVGDVQLVQVRLQQECIAGEQSCTQGDGNLLLEVVNRGFIPWIHEECSLLDENVFRIGQSTKANGTG
ncbi:MAG: hypothetical protein ACOC0D_10460, partial [Spirochaeta sp.]